LTIDLDVGLLLPCNVVVYEEDGGSVVGIMDPMSMMGVMHRTGVEKVAREARARLERSTGHLSS
jgi:uncharacterized protein (DUF302 family)